MIEIRPATSDDAEALAELRWEFRSKGDSEDEPRDAFVHRCAAWMRRELSDGGSWQAWVAVDQQAIVGQVWLRTVQKIPNPIVESEQLAYLSNLYVAAGSRGGVGSRLLDRALESCRAAAVDRVVLWPTRRSVTLYASRGFSRAADVMELKL
jgi:predicted N-acetyltransferase YhbS